MKLEVIAISVRDAVLAQQYGADRLELVAAMKEGGLTPSYAMIKKVVKSVDIPVNVMIRPHSFSHVYTPEEVSIMLDDVQMVKELGANGIVCGALTKDHKVDIETISAISQVANSMDITYHRAFDEIDDQVAALKEIMQLGSVSRVLTSGGAESVDVAVDQLKRLQRITKDNPFNILAGGGFTVENVHPIIRDTQIQEVHFGSGVRIDNDFSKDIDQAKINRIKELFNKH